jgi:hypothetical protein
VVLTVPITDIGRSAMDIDRFPGERAWAQPVLQSSFAPERKPAGNPRVDVSTGATRQYAAQYD